MSHAKTQIKDAIQNILSTDAGWKATLMSRVPPLRAAFPFLLVYSDGDTLASSTPSAPAVLERDLAIIVVALLQVPKDKEKAEKQIDEICAEIETKLTPSALRAQIPGVNITLSYGDCRNNFLVDENGNVDHAEAVLSFSVKYMTVEGQPETLI